MGADFEGAETVPKEIKIVDVEEKMLSLTHELRRKRVKELLNAEKRKEGSAIKHSKRAIRPLVRKVNGER